MKEKNKKPIVRKKKVKVIFKGLEDFEHSELSRLCIGPNDSLGSTIQLK